MSQTYSSGFKSNVDYHRLNLSFYRFFKATMKNTDEIMRYQKLDKKCQSIQKLLKQLLKQQQSQWAETIYIKCKQLQKSNTNPTDQLIESLYILVHISKQFDINYNSSHVHQIIKDTYYDVYKEKILEVFKQSKMTIEQYQVLYYQDSWFTKITNFFRD